MVAAVQASILLGAVLGGLLLDQVSITATLIASVLLAAFAVLIVRDGRALLKPR
jgi:predicted MFS family arabinose efflux permease